MKPLSVELEPFSVFSLAMGITKQLLFFKHLLCARWYAKHFTHLVSFYPPSPPPKTSLVRSITIHFSTEKEFKCLQQDHMASKYLS